MDMEVVAGGYFIVKPEPRPDYLLGTFPEKIITLSECICHRIPDYWSYLDISAPTRVLKDELGICDESFIRIRNQADLYLKTGEIKWPNIFRTLSGAQSFLRALPLSAGIFEIIGCGLAVGDYSQYIQATSCKTRCGVSMVLAEKHPLSDEGRFLGYDVLGDDVIGSHSWLCKHLLKDDQSACLSDKAAINEAGFLPSYPEARKMSDFANQDDVLTEPVRWFPWKIFLYPGERRATYRAEEVAAEVTA